MSANMFLQELKPNPSQVPNTLSTNNNPSSDSTQKSSDPVTQKQKPSIETTEQLQKKTNESRIPVPASPILLRRHNSLRLKGEVDGMKRFSGLNHFQTSMAEKSPKYRNGNVSHTSPVAKDRGSACPSAGLQEFSAAGKPPLKRGYSFVERGQKSGGSKNSENLNHSSGGVGGRVSNAAGTPLQPQRSGNKATGGPGELSPSVRVRSLSLSLSNTRISSSKSPKVVSSSPNQLVSPGIRDNFSSGTIDCCWDTESVTSIGSSVTSCDHAAIARNGTTFSGRSMKYVFHCNQHSATTGDEYLTPTQRAHRQVKKLKHLLHQAKKDLEQKDSDILKLTREVVELGLHKAALNSPGDNSQSNSSDAVTVKNENTNEHISPERDQVDFLVHPQYNSSFTDSGHFEDGTNSSVHSKDSVFDETKSPCKPKTVETSDKAVTAQIYSLDYHHHGSEQSKLIMDYEKRIQELIKTHEEETYHLKQKHNHKIEELLQRITEINSRYWELVPELETGKERIKELEQQLVGASKKLEEQEETAKKTYLKMYAQGQESARQERENLMIELAHQHPNRVSVPELLQELQVTKNELENIKDVEYASTSNNLQPLLSAKEALSLWVLGARKAMYRQLMEAKSKNKIDPGITLQFLKSAVYYFLTDKENSHGHLKAIESILGFTSNEISNIEKARNS